MSPLQWTRVVWVSMLGLGLATGCGARRPGEAAWPTLVPTAGQPAAVMQPTLPPAWTTTPAVAAATPAPLTEAATPEPAATNESVPPAAATASPSDQAGDAVEQLLDALVGQLDQTDTLQDANDLIP